MNKQGVAKNFTLYLQFSVVARHLLFTDEKR